MRCVQKPCKICGHYRERMSECRNCDPSDMPYKVCFQKKVYKNNPLMSKIFREEYATY